MTRRSFLALTGAPERIRALLSNLVPNRSAPARLNRVLDCPDLVAFTPPETSVILLDDERGLIVGTLFGRSDNAPRADMTGSEARHAAWSGGRTLISDFWGSYAALLRDEGAVTVLRDPSGAVPVYHFERDGVGLYMSDPDLACDLGLFERPVDEEFIRQWLNFPFLRTERTGLDGVSELLPGTARTTRPGHATLTILWSPWRYAAPASVTFEEAAERLRDCLLGTVAVQLKQFRTLSLELSGGLDSSIVAACLGDAGMSFAAANFVTRMPDGDERDYARLVAEAFDAALETLAEDEEPLSFELPDGPRLRPPLSPVLQPLHRAFRRFADRVGTDAMVTGAGGDNLFCYLTTASPALDALQDRGPRQALATLSDIAVRAGCTFWTAAAFALRKRRALARRPAWQSDDRFLAPAAHAGRPDPHPWLDAPPDARPGKIEHVNALVRAFHFLDPEPAAPRIAEHPLLNQPLMELCLSIPTWLWVSGGRDRAVARAAFAGLLPEAILHRRTKGRLESMCARAFDDNRDRLADFLLAGALARRGLLDLTALGAYLRAPGPVRGEAYFRIFDLASLESWLRPFER